MLEELNEIPSPQCIFCHEFILKNGHIETGYGFVCFPCALKELEIAYESLGN